MQCTLRCTALHSAPRGPDPPASPARPAGSSHPRPSQLPVLRGITRWSRDDGDRLRLGVGPRRFSRGCLMGCSTAIRRWCSDRTEDAEAGRRAPVRPPPLSPAHLQRQGYCSSRNIPPPLTQRQAIAAVRSWQAFGIINPSCPVTLGRDKDQIPDTSTYLLMS